MLPIQYTNPFGSTVRGSINFMGQVFAAINACSKDQNVTLGIPVRTYARDENGRPLSRIDIYPVEALPPAPAGAVIVGTPYEFGPDNATFSPAILLTWQYDPANMPSGADAASLKIAFWDEGNGTWVPLEGGAVDAVKHTIAVKISHFSAYAVISRKPAFFEYGKLTVSPAEATLDGKAPAGFTVSAAVSNTGGYAGNITVVLKINDIETQKQEVTLEPGESREVAFKETKSEPGVYSIDVNGQTGQFAVKVRPAAFTLAEPVLSQSEITVGGNTTATAVVTNTGGSPGTYRAVLTIDGIETEAKELAVAAGASETVEFNIPGATAGEHQVSINGMEKPLRVAAGPENAWFDWRVSIGPIAAAALIGISALLLLKRRQK